jgi:DNA-binding MarR family transcriptional regulator
MCIYSQIMNELNDNHARERLARLAETCGCNNLRRAARAVTNYYDELLRQADLQQADLHLRATQCPLLVLLYLAGPQTINEMAENLALDRTTLTRNLRPLEQAGFLSIAPGSDLRTRVVTLTEQGEAALLRVLPLWEQAQAHMVEGMGQARFAALLAQLSDAAALAQQD